MYYVYVLKSKKNGQLYKGFTKDLRKRMSDHNSGRAKFTSRAKPWELVYCEAFISERSAKQEEIFLKSGKGKERLKYILSN